MSENGYIVIAYWQGQPCETTHAESLPMADMERDHFLTQKADRVVIARVMSVTEQ